MVRLPLLPLCTIAALVLVPTSLSPAQTVGRVLLMNNGAVLPKSSPGANAGGIEKRGDFYVVRIAEQSSASIPIDQVKYVGQDLDDLYRFKVAATKRWEVGDHYQMTSWCLRNGMLDQATQHYQEVARRAGEHPRVKQLALQLERQLLEEPGFREFLGLAPIEQQQAANPSLAAPSLAAQKPSSSVTTASSYLSDVAFQPEIAARYSQKVQPILMNRCSQAACHGAQSQNALRLLEPYGQQYARMSSENLRSVLGQIDSQIDQLPRLIEYATKPHGIQRAAAIALTEVQLLSELRNWIEFVRNPVVAAVATGTESSADALRAAQARQFVPYSPAVRLVPVTPGQNGLRQVPRDEGGLQFPDGAPSLSEIDALERQLQSMLGETPRSAPNNSLPSTNSLPSILPGQPSSQPQNRPKDPFDPEEFNRQAPNSANPTPGLPQ